MYITGHYSKTQLDLDKLKILTDYADSIKILYCALLWIEDWNQLLKLLHMKDYITEMTLEDLQK